MNNKIVMAYQAKCFYSTYQLLGDTDRKSGSVMYIIPRLVNGMFAAELALKALLAYEEIPYKNEHNLVNLYYLLPDDLFNEIGCRFHTLCPCYSKEEYMKGFITVSEAFVDARYSFEKPYAAFDLGFCDGIIQAIVETLLTRHDIVVEERSSQVSFDFDAKVGELQQAMMEKNLKRIHFRNTP